MQTIRVKIDHKEKLFRTKEDQRKLSTLLNQETFALRVKNKEINIERQRRKDDYQREIYLRKLVDEDHKYEELKLQRQKETEQRLLL